MGMFAPGRSETVNYHYWPIRFGWSSGPYQQTLWRWVRRAIDSRRWTLDYPHRYTCLSSLEIHRAAARRMWHGWPIGGSSREYGWTLHLGRFKVYFGDPDTEYQKVALSMKIKRPKVDTTYRVDPETVLHVDKPPKPKKKTRKYEK